MKRSRVYLVRASGTDPEERLSAKARSVLLRTGFGHELVKLQCEFQIMLFEQKIQPNQIP